MHVCPEAFATMERGRPRPRKSGPLLTYPSRARAPTLHVLAHIVNGSPGRRLLPPKEPVRFFRLAHVFGDGPSFQRGSQPE